MSNETRKSIPRSWGELRQLVDSSFLRFLAVGGSNFLISFTIYNILIWGLPEHGYRIAVSQLVSYAVGTAWSFIWNRRFTFRSHGEAKRQAVRFVVLQAVLAVSSAALISYCVSSMGMNPRLAWLLVMMVVTVVNYLICRLWAFK